VLTSLTSVQLVPLYVSVLVTLVVVYPVAPTAFVKEPKLAPELLAVFTFPPDAQVAAAKPPGLTTLKVPLVEL
jgi:hypothetical protein